MENCYRPCQGIQSRPTGRPRFLALGLMLIWMLSGRYFLLSFASDIGFLMATCYMFGRLLGTTASSSASDLESNCMW